ncbi:MAG: hypothetical protein QXG39_02870 [Candidatus Aenigmatarchaeota archaeon]
MSYLEYLILKEAAKERVREELSRALFQMAAPIGLGAGIVGAMLAPNILRSLGFLGRFQRVTPWHRLITGLATGGLAYLPVIRLGRIFKES